MKCEGSITLYAYYEDNAFNVDFCNGKYEWRVPDNGTVLFKYPVSVPVPDITVEELRQKTIKTLEEKRERIFADAARQAQAIQAQINNLLALPAPTRADQLVTFEQQAVPSPAPSPNFEDDIPF